MTKELKINFDEKSKGTVEQKVRVNITTDQDSHQKLKKLAVSCEMTKTALAEEIVRMAVNHVDIIDYFQNKYNQEAKYLVKPTKKDGKLVY